MINCFSGCPGDCETSEHPNWVVCPWPDDFSEIVKWQWKEKLIPYWKEKVAFAKEHGVHKFALEMHPGFCVYNPETALRLREAVGPEIGVNFDPSHLIWRGIDPAYAIRVLERPALSSTSTQRIRRLTNTTLCSTAYWIPSLMEMKQPKLDFPLLRLRKRLCLLERYGVKPCHDRL